MSTMENDEIMRKLQGTPRSLFLGEIHLLALAMYAVSGHHHKCNTRHKDL